MSSKPFKFGRRFLESGACYEVWDIKLKGNSKESTIPLDSVEEFLEEKARQKLNERTIERGQQQPTSDRFVEVFSIEFLSDLHWILHLQYPPKCYKNRVIGYTMCVFSIIDDFFGPITEIQGTPRDKCQLFPIGPKKKDVMRSS